MADPRPCLLRAHGLHKAYGTRVVLSGISLDVYSGELVAIEGPSGSGKSTLLHCLGGLISPDEGTVEVGSRKLADLQEPRLTRFRRTHLGYVFQFHGLVPDLTALENVAVARWCNGVGKREAMAKASVLLEALGLEQLAGSVVQTLSGGEAQRVAVARALVNDPDVVLADEPTASLDAAMKQSVMDTIRATTVEGRAVVVATHDSQVAEYADRVLGVETTHVP